MNNTDEQYTPDDEDVFIAYRFMSLGLMRDPDDKPHDPAATAEAGAEFRRWLAAHDARVRRDAARERFEDFIAYVQIMSDGTPLHAGRIVLAEVIRLAEVYVKHHIPEETP